MANIHAKEHAIKEAFSDLHAYRIPPYQRPYSWGVEQTSALINDLLIAASGFSPKNIKSQPTPYFLGSIVLIKDEKSPDADVIDGQQRLTTLALLLSALRVSFTDAKRQKTFGELLFEEGDSLVGTKDRCRLTLRERDHSFFEQNILRHATLDQLGTVAQGALSDPQKRLIENCALLIEKLKGLTSEARESLAAYILQHTFLVVVSTPSLESAFRIFSVLNDRGLDLTVADILKAEIIGQIPEGEQPVYTDKWEDAEEELGTQEFATLFSHIRMIYGQSKLRKSVLEGFREVVKANTRPKTFIDDDLIPLADAYAEVLNASFQSVKAETDKRINRFLRLLNRMGDRDWVSPAILFIRKHRDKPDDILIFLKDLERLAAGMWLLRQDENGRIDRYGKVLKSIEQGDDLLASALQLSKIEIEGISTALSGNIYELSPKPKRTMVLLRLDEELSSGEATYEFDLITVEHVLPQNPPEGSKWLEWWPSNVLRETNVHRLGNLALLNRRQNSAAKNWEFEKKKDKYFKTRGGATPFVITSDACLKAEWTVDIFNERQERFLKKLQSIWRLE